MGRIGGRPLSSGDSPPPLPGALHAAFGLPSSAKRRGRRDARRRFGRDGISVSEDHIREGLRRARWPGRLELFPARRKSCSTASTTEGGAEAFARSFGRLFPGVHPVFVVALTGGKDPAKVFGPIAPFASYMVTTRPDSSRIPVAEPEELAQSIRALGVPAEAQETADKALERARELALELAGDEAMVCICGSLYLVGDLRGRLVADV